MNDNVILADADFVDQVAFDLTVNFERMLERRIPKTDLARWAECVALDGGLRHGDHHTMVVLVHDNQQNEMKNFAPGNYSSELANKAFQGNLGEFDIQPTTGESFVSKEALFIDTLQTLLQSSDIKRLMIIPNESYYQEVRKVINQQDDDDKRITVFAMQPMPGGNFRQEILGYSLMAALGIKGDELK